ncbi:Uncharacterised protein [Lactiplantibacillus plantarum]|nr:Uncharacterised protein [Lactiplantibacillus plantarum]
MVSIDYYHLPLTIKSEPEPTNYGAQHATQININFIN